MRAWSSVLTWFGLALVGVTIWLWQGTQSSVLPGAAAGIGLIATLLLTVLTGLIGDVFDAAFPDDGAFLILVLILIVAAMVEASIVLIYGIPWLIEQARPIVEKSVSVSPDPYVWLGILAVTALGVALGLHLASRD